MEISGTTVNCILAGMGTRTAHHAAMFKQSNRFIFMEKV